MGPLPSSGSRTLAIRFRPLQPRQEIKQPKTYTPQGLYNEMSRLPTVKPTYAQGKCKHQTIKSSCEFLTVTRSWNVGVKASWKKKRETKTNKKSRDKAGCIKEFSRKKAPVINICKKMKEEITYIIIRTDMYWALTICWASTLRVLALTLHEVGAVIIPILQLRKLRHRGCKYVVKC